jgi:hypothetical protein
MIGKKVRLKKEYSYPTLSNSKIYVVNEVYEYDEKIEVIDDYCDERALPAKWFEEAFKVLK